MLGSREDTKKSTQTTNLTNLPLEVLTHIINLLDLQALKDIREVSQLLNIAAIDQTFSANSLEKTDNQKTLLKKWNEQPTTYDIRNEKILFCAKSTEYSIHDRMNGLLFILNQHGISPTLPANTVDKLTSHLRSPGHTNVFIALETIQCLIYTLGADDAFRLYTEIILLIERLEDENIINLCVEITPLLINRLNTEQIYRIFTKIRGQTTNLENVSDELLLFKINTSLSKMNIAQVRSLQNILLKKLDDPNTADLELSLLLIIMGKNKAFFLNNLHIAIESINKKNDLSKKSVLSSILLLTHHIQQFKNSLKDQHITAIKNLYIHLIVNHYKTMYHYIPNAYDLIFDTRLIKNINNKELGDLIEVIQLNIQSTIIQSIKFRLILVLSRLIPQMNNQQAAKSFVLIIENVQNIIGGNNHINQIIAKFSKPQVTYIANTLIDNLLTKAGDTQLSLIQLYYLADFIDLPVQKMAQLINTLIMIIKKDTQHDVFAIELLLKLIPKLPQVQFNEAFNAIYQYTQTELFEDYGDYEDFFTQLSLNVNRLSPEQLSCSVTLFWEKVSDASVNKEKILSNANELIDLQEDQYTLQVIQAIKGEIEDSNWDDITIHYSLRSILHKLNDTQIDNLYHYSLRLTKEQSTIANKTGFMILSALLTRLTPTLFSQAVETILTNRFLIFHQNMSGLTEALKVISENSLRLENHNIRNLINILLDKTIGWSFERETNKKIIFDILSTYNKEIPKDLLFKLVNLILQDKNYYIQYNRARQLKISLNYLLNSFQSADKKPLLSIVSLLLKDSNANIRSLGLDTISFLIINKKCGIKDFENTPIQHSRFISLLDFFDNINSRACDTLMPDRYNNSIFHPIPTQYRDSEMTSMPETSSLKMQ